MLLLVLGVMLASVLHFSFPLEKSYAPTPIAKVSNYGTINRDSKIDYVKLAKAFRGYSDEDVQCLAMNIYYEARDQSVLGQHAVAHVTINRVKHKKWRDTVCGVVYQRKQFSWTIKGMNYKPKDKLAWKRARLIAIDTLSNPDAKDLSDGALYYHADYVTPKDWDFKQLAKLDQVGAHIFYRYK